MTLPIRILALLLALVATTAFSQTAPTVSSPMGTGGANGKATLKADVMTNGATTTVTFSYHYNPDGPTKTATTTLTDAAGSQPAMVALTDLVGGKTYSFTVTASNSAGSSNTVNGTFMEPAYAGKPTTTSATTKGTPASSIATLNGIVTANGTPGTVHFEFGPPNGPANVYEKNVMADPPAHVDAGDVDKKVTGKTSELVRNATYHYRLVFVDDATLTSVNGNDVSFVTNNAPVANTDTVNAAGGGPTTINPLVNDRDPDGDSISLVGVATPPQHGTAVESGDSIIYTPDPSSTGFDTFTYTIKDSFGLPATGTINIRSIRAAFAGTHGGFIKRANGKEVGYFTVTATASGSFTGIAIIDGKRFVVSGTISADGVYRGFARQGDSAISVFLFTDQNDSGSSITALFDNGSLSSELTLSPSDRTERPGLTGRYTAGISAGGSGPSNGNDPGMPPEGTGWMAIRVSGDATAAIKGRLTDGRSFSTKGTVNFEDGVATLTFYDDVETMRVIGNLTVGDTVGGTVHLDRHTSGEGLYPRGYDITQGVDGARYVKPRDGDRVLDTATSKGQDLTISFSGAGLGGLTRDLYLNDRDNVKVLNAGPENLEVRIDRKSGRFRTKFDVGNEGKKLKATGVLIQAVGGGTGGRGTGTFETSFGTGTVTISASGSGGTPTPTPTPTPEPTPVVP